jgi:hypothetical protein
MEANFAETPKMAESQTDVPRLSKTILHSEKAIKVADEPEVASSQLCSHPEPLQFICQAIHSIVRTVLPNALTSFSSIYFAHVLVSCQSLSRLFFFKSPQTLHPEPKHKFQQRLPSSATLSYLIWSVHG